jgi:aryl-alcohol dehydrogenase-like predicted oxidoreductase
MRLPGPGVWGPPTDRDEAIRTVRRAVELGVRVIDSAWYYGLDVANEVIAAAIRPYPDDLVLITKLGGARTDDGTWVSGLTPDALRAGCERDLRVLGVDAVPVVHLRWMERSGITFDEALDVMLDLQAQGKIQRIGLSNVTAEQLSAALAKTPIASVSNHFGPAEQSDAATLEMCAAQNIAYLPFFPLGGGRAATATGNALGAVAAKHNATPAQVAIAWLLGRSPAMLPIPGTSKVAHLEDNVAAAALRLDAADLAELTTP